MIRVTGLGKAYAHQGGAVNALQDVDLAIDAGDFIMVHGPSGSGKTTLLMALGGMVRPTAGSVEFHERNIYSWSSRQRNQYRKRHVGFVFQKFFLLPYLSAYDNIRFALATRGYRGDCERRILELAKSLGMEHRLNHRPCELSVGEQQRIAMARAIAVEPDLLLADEPTGNLDRANANAFVEYLLEENRRGRTIVLATHDESLLSVGNRTVELRDGRLYEASPDLASVCS